MSTILYYSNYCKSSNKVLQLLSKYDMKNQVHFICIDGRVSKNGNMYAILPNGQEMLIPKNITAVPSLIILNQQYNVISGVDDIMNFFQKNITKQINKATKNNTVPVTTQCDDGYSAFGGFGSGIVSDHFSFLDQDDSEMSAKGDGGTRQMHYYAKPTENLLYTQEFENNTNEGRNNTNTNTNEGNKIKNDDTSSLLDKYKQERDKDLQTYGPKMNY
jgi:hypothetical protein